MIRSDEIFQVGGPVVLDEMVNEKDAGRKRNMSGTTNPVRKRGVADSRMNSVCLSARKPISL